MSANDQPAKTYKSILRHQGALGDEFTPAANKASWWSLHPWIATVPVFGLGCLLLMLTGFEFSPLRALILGGMCLAASYLREMVLNRQIKQWATRLADQWGIRSDLAEAEKKLAGRGRSLFTLTQSLERALEHHHVSQRDSFLASVATLMSTLEARDPCTRGHSSKTAHLAVRLGKRMNLDQADLYEIHLGGLLHDIGKIGIPDDILLKPEGLTKDEYEAMKAHPEIGARILAGIDGMDRVADIVKYHHEMYDGRGYPDGLKGEEIPLGARLVSVADTYLSMVEDRPYRKGRSAQKAVKELKRVAGQQLDPDAIRELEGLIEEEAKQGRGLYAELDDTALEATTKAA
ncbi:MAG: HD-GYP domain-containing protein [Candidatus Eisenbacteria bacterium]|uniref:HD-GYP domain-containing protein n=1 Tax=Eiseniibacteriota bacterium TaxID=2212470 RepID=A0A7Y2EB37_UNCEI|nr:HD-GYP domain-containing protein [Candidatus Eisenbacteria bacterium]